MPEDQYQLFKSEVLARPDEDDPRLVYADWLSEQGDPRGEFIRVQCALHNTEAEDAEYPQLAKLELKLLKSHGDGWKQPVMDRVARAKLYRGFIEQVQMGVRQFIRNAASVFEQEPVRRVLLTALSTKSLDDFLASESVPCLRELSVSAELETKGWAKFGQCPKWEKMEALYLGGNFDVPNFGALLKNCSFAKQLKHLHFNSMYHDHVDSTVLAKGHSFKNLRSLDLSCAALRAPELFATIQGGHPKLEHLVLQRMGDKSQHSVLLPTALGELPSLKTLDLSSDAFDVRAHLRSRGIQVEARHFESLELGHNSIDQEFLTDLLVHWVLPSFKRLNLSHTSLVGSDLEAIHESPTFRGLKYLNLSHNQTLGQASVLRAIRAGAFDNLRILRLEDNGYGPEVAQALLEREKMNFNQLDLSLNHVPNDLQKQMRKRFGSGVCKFSRN